MPAPLPSRLDANQVLQGAYDEATGRLRTDSTSNIVNADIDVSLDATEDNVAISDPNGNFLNVNTDGSINVVLGSGLVTASYYAEITGIVAGITTLVSSYTATAGNLLQKVAYSGTNIAEYELRINGITQDKKRTYFGSSLDGTFDFNNGIVIPLGQTVQIYVIHNRPDIGDFNARIQIGST